MRRMFMVEAQELGWGGSGLGDIITPCLPVPERFFAALRRTTYCYGHDNTAMTTTKGR